MYVSKERLAELVVEAQARGMSEEMAAVLTRMAKTVAIREFHLRGDEVEEVAQEFVLLVLTKLDLIDPERPVFNYLTCLCFNLLRGRWRSKKHEEKKLWAMAERMSAING